MSRGRPSGGGRSRCVTYSPRHARCHFLTPIDSRAHETRGIAPCADDVFAKANTVALVSAPFLPEPGSQARVVDGGQVLHVSRLGEPRYSPRLADCARTPPTGAPVAVLARGRIARHRPLDSAADRDWAVPDYHTYLQAALKRKPATINNALPAVDELYTRRGLGPSKAARVEVPATAPRALGERVHYLRAVKALPSPRDQALALVPFYAGAWIAENRRDRPRRRAPGASRPRQPAAARRATPATTRSASTRRGSARGRRRSRSRGARSSSSP